LSIIVQNLVDQIGKKFLDRFRQDYMSASNSEAPENQEQIADQLPKELLQEKIHQAKVVNKHSNEAAEDLTAEIPERSEQKLKTATTTPSKPTSKQMLREEENSSTGNRNFDINMSEIAQKTKVQQVERPSAPHSASEFDTPNSKNKNVASYPKKVSYVNSESEDINKQVSPNCNRADGSTFAYSEARGEEYSQYDNETGSFKAAPEQMNNGSRYKNQPDANNFWSSSERSSVHGRKTFYSTQRGNVSSPERIATLSNSMLFGSYSRWSGSNGRPDMSILDSEFSYGQGNSFSKSPKKFHHHIQNIPGPGQYELEEGMQATRTKSPNRSFPKSPKVPSYFTKSSVPGAIYYPTIHFTSK